MRVVYISMPLLCIISDKFCSPHDDQHLTMAGEAAACMDATAARDVSDYFASSTDNLTLLRMLPLGNGVVANNGMISDYSSERMIRQQQVVIPIAAKGVTFAAPEELGDGGGGRWPRQETLTLLEVRARLNPRFRQSTQKAALWDEVSRIMAEEYGYNRSGKKCKEKLENLYKYYKKTKQGKVGKHDGRHYRFFKQLEALYGDQGNNDLLIAAQTKGISKSVLSGQNSSMHKVRASAFNVFQSTSTCEGMEFSLSISNDLDDSSTDEEVQDEDDLNLEGRTSMEESSLRELIELQIRKLVEMQEALLDRILKRIEQFEQERISREEEWRRQEAARFELDQHMWNTEQARIKARDDIFIKALERISRDREGAKFSQTGEIVMS